VRFSAGLGALMTNDIEFFIISGCLKIRCDCIELGVCGPGGTSRESFASLSQLAFTEIIRHIDEVQFMLDVGAFNDLSKPLTLISSVARKIEDHRNPPRQEILDVKRQRISHSSGALDEVLDASDLAWIQSIKEFVLNEEDGVPRPGQPSRVGRLASGHLPAHEVQPRPLLSHVAPKGLTRR